MLLTSTNLLAEVIYSHMSIAVSPSPLSFGHHEVYCSVTNIFGESSDILLGFQGHKSYKGSSRSSRESQIKVQTMSSSEVQTYKLGNFTLQSGEVIPDAFIAYQTLGDPSHPAIIYPTWYSGRKHNPAKRGRHTNF